MIFNTWTFAAFATIVLALYWGIVPQRYKPHFLVVTSAIFYAFSVPAYLLVVAALGAVTFGFGRALLLPNLTAGARKTLIVCSVSTIAGVLLGFKYLKFFALTIDQVAAHTIVPIPAIVVPLAISFFTFEFVHVLVDIYLCKIVALEPLDFAIFTMFFPTLVAGPIKRYQSFVPQVRTIVEPPREILLSHLYRIGIGVAKKTIIADSMTLLTQPITTSDPDFGRLDYWVALFAYAAKIYFDFSGYSDIAIGMAGLLGFAIPENFDMPYRSPDIATFWRRWHVSLSTWIRDYIFIPLGGSRGAPLTTTLNLTLAMSLAGLWHGANWTFVAWGLWHGLGLIVHRVWTQTIARHVPLLGRRHPFIDVASIATTFAFVAVGWLFFAAPSVSNAYAAFTHLWF